MTETVRVIAHSGLRLRDSPRDGATLSVLSHSEQVQVLGRETWLRVKHGNQVGFVLADHVEPVAAGLTHSPPVTASRFSAAVKIIEYSGSAVFRGEPLRIDEEFLTDLEAIEREAGQRAISIWVTSSLREPNKPVANAVVTPARFSNHHVGHAIDVNLILKGNFYRSTDLANPAKLPAAIQEFFNALRGAHKLRWGNDFSSPDPVHIDNGLNVDAETIFRQKLERLWAT